MLLACDTLSHRQVDSTPARHGSTRQGSPTTTGSVPRRLPAAIGGNLKGVYTVRTLADVDAMKAEFVAGKRLVVVGGGYIGLEAAAVARKLGLEVTVLEMAPRILQRVAAPATSDYFRTLHRAHGVDIREGVALRRLPAPGAPGCRAEDASDAALPRHSGAKPPAPGDAAGAGRRQGPRLASDKNAFAHRRPRC